jgi:hypothetical protein
MAADSPTLHANEKSPTVLVLPAAFTIAVEIFWPVTLLVTSNSSKKKQAVILKK